MQLRPAQPLTNRTRRIERRPNGRWSSPGTAYQQRVFGSDLNAQLHRGLTLENSRRPLPARIGRKLIACCSDAVVAEGTCGTVKLCERRCRSRCCIRCAKLRARKVFAQALDLIKTMDAPAFITLTVRSTDQSLSEQLRVLRRAFAKFRRTAGWKAHCPGGLYVTEITLNKKTGQWHPHLHVVGEWKYWKHAAALAQWEQIVGEHAGLHVKRIGSRMALARYVASYVAKGGNLEDVPAERWAEWAEELHGTRLFQTFGNLHAIKPATAERDWKFHRPLWWIGDIAHVAALGHHRAGELIQLLDRGVKMSAAFAQRYLPPDLHPCSNRACAQDFQAIYDFLSTCETGPPNAMPATSPPAD